MSRAMSPSVARAFGGQQLLQGAVVGARRLVRLDAHLLQQLARVLVHILADLVPAPPQGSLRVPGQAIKGVPGRLPHSSSTSEGRRIGW